MSLITNTGEHGLLVAVDGPAGAGKSTVCRAVAKRLEAKYLDTGAMYRVATLYVLQQGVALADTQKVIELTHTLPLTINDDPYSREVLLDGHDVSELIRTPEINKNVSAVSAIAQVRTNLVHKQRELAKEAGRCILDGRDIGTHVLPDAPAKFFLTASPEVRAQRRYEQERAQGIETDYALVLADVLRRDELDTNRAISPLRPAQDAIIVDSSALSLEQVIDTLITLIEKTSRENNS
ncbi:(d)CMP kinase [Corynebacterium sp. sy017]|uniref:(d)CMP kinase n=1 Tax=unclassified Corynebacterium TaxID=2624378 RepID=UPI0011872B37|nr:MULTISPECIES: (d)CMP kinase [unclassified Corynebacterium]MBP3087566.1 (d)CMP kinase [Corynebacterium sp. sy017]TSD92142.1 (d)CMP kinase [Corynebacterium sp. SY003]